MTDVASVLLSLFFGLLAVMFVASGMAGPTAASAFVAGAVM